MAGSGYSQQHYHNGGSNNIVQQSVVGEPNSTNTAASYIPNASFTASDETYTSSTAGGVGTNNNAFSSTHPLHPTNNPTNVNSHGGYNPDFPSAPFSQPANQPSSSSAANWPPSDGLFDLNNVELFAGFDIPFWLDDEQYVPFLDG
jgi:hypothetical protein